MAASAPGSLGSTAGDPTPTTEHVVTVIGLTADTQYYYAVESADAAGNAAVDDNGGAYYSFTAAGRAVFFAGFVGDEGAANSSVRYESLYSAQMSALYIEYTGGEEDGAADILSSGDCLLG